MGRNMRWFAMVLMLVAVLAPAWAQAPVRVVEEARRSFYFGSAYALDPLVGTADSTVAAARQTFTNTDKWPGTWAMETWATTTAAQVVDSVITLKRDLFVPGGSWTAWYRVDTLVAADFTAGVSTHIFGLIPVGAIKPYSFQTCDKQTDGSAVCTTYTHHVVHVYP